MKNQYKTEYDKIALTEEQKNTLIAKMKETQGEGKIVELKPHVKKRTFVRAVAACLAFAIVGLGLFFSMGKEAENSFIITANASEVKTIPDDAIGIFTGEAIANSYCYEVTQGGPEFKECKSIYPLSQFAVKGKNIEKISVHSNNGDCIIRVNEIVESEDFTAENYNRKDFGVGYDLLNQEGFTYENKNPSSNMQIFRFDDLIRYIVTPNLENPVIAEKLDRIDKLLNSGMELEKNQDNLDRNEIVERDKALSTEVGRLTTDYLEMTLRDASIDVTITFTDGTKQTQTIDVDMIIQKDDEIIFDAKYDDYSKLTDKEKDNSVNIVFRYAE